MEYQDTPVFWERFARLLGEAAAQTASAVLPTLGPKGGRILSEEAAGGDLQTESDETAGTFLREFLSYSPVPLMLLDEKTGALLPLHDNPVVGVVADELDGTRPARMGMPTCCVSLAAFPLDGEHVLKNVRCGVIIRLDTEMDYTFVSGQGVWRMGKPLPVAPDNTPFHQASVYIDDGMGHLGLHGACMQGFTPHVRHGLVRLCSVCYAGTLMVEGGLHVVLHTTYREYQTWPEVRPLIREVWGPMAAPFPYDFAALVPLLWECGFTVTDAWGRSLDEMRLDLCGEGHEVPGMVAASNADLHRVVMQTLDRRERFLLDRREEVIRVLLS
jgi:fructose-1,6-bisphosphatase/inositol monophosphatase family enzyme